MTYNPVCPRCQAPLLASTATLYNRNVCPCDWPPVFREVTPQAGDGYDVLTVSAGTPPPPAWVKDLP